MLLTSVIFRFSPYLIIYIIVSIRKINLPRTVPNFYSFISLGTCLSQRRNRDGEEQPKDKKEKCSRSRHGRTLMKSAVSGEFLQEREALPIFVCANIPR